MGLADHGEAVSENRTGRKDQSKLDGIIEALDEEDRQHLLTWLHDPTNWPAFRISRALKRMAQAEARPELSISHSPIIEWRMHNGIKDASH